jgi:DNA-binding PadR family transcriptional regulator
MTTGGVSFRYFVLGLLDQQPMSGYDIKRLLKGLNWLISGSSFGSIYPTLHALLEDELVTVEVVPRPDRLPRKLYDISEQGRQTLRERLEMPVSAAASLKAFVMRLILIQDYSQSGLAAHLEQWRAQVVDHRDALKGMSDGSENASVGWELALDYGLALTDTELDWLDRALSRVDGSCGEEVTRVVPVTDVG